MHEILYYKKTYEKGDGKKFENSGKNVRKFKKNI